MAISKRLRFEVFKRDKFTCQYCGQATPVVVLEVDHIQPKSKSGKDDINNLITACFDCNRGKSNVELNNVPNSVKQNFTNLKEKELQVKAYNKFLKQINKRIEESIENVSDIFIDYFPKYSINIRFKNNTIRNFLNYLPEQSLIDAMNVSCSKITNPNEAIKYFCGICWCKIREGKV